MRDVQIVVVHEGDAAAEHRVDRAAVNLLKVVLAGFVGRVRLAREDDLHRPPCGGEDADQPLRVVEDQLGALVAGEPPREPDGQGVRIEQRAGRDDRVRR